MRTIAMNHTAEIWRDTATEDEYESTHAPVKQNTPTSHNCRPDQAWSGDLQRHGGDRQSSSRVWYLHRDLSVQSGDVLKITAGPESPATWRVLTAVPVTDGRSRVHHIEANCDSTSVVLA